MKYPNIIFFRYEKYSEVDKILLENDKELLCTLNIISKKEKLNKLYSCNYHILVTYGPSDKEYFNDIYEILEPSRICHRWIHYKNISNIHEFNRAINYCYIHNTIQPRGKTIRPVFSLFTTTYNSYEKIIRAYDSLKTQTMKDWEWVIVDDSPDDKHFEYLRKIFINDCRVRFYRRSKNSGSIGDVKNEAVALCRGKYVLELDHDDEILPDVLKDATDVFEKDPEVGFIYMDFINLYEDGGNFAYGDFICKGYGGYYCQKYNGKWVNVYITPNINNITLSHLVCCPNHPRIWRRETLNNLENYSEFLPICDDYEILLRTAVHTKIVKIHKLGYVQYMNQNNNNFSLIRNGEINRIGPQYISPMFYQTYKIHEIMKEKNAHEPEEYVYNCSQIWKRDSETYQHVHCNEIINPNFTKQYCIIGLDYLIKNIEEVTNKYIYNPKKNDFILLDNKYSKEEITNKLDELGFDRMKCYSLKDTTEQELINYFNWLYKSCANYEILKEGENVVLNIHNEENPNTLFKINNEEIENLSDIIIKEINH